jgi:hypothetical protein
MAASQATKPGAFSSLAAWSAQPARPSTGSPRPSSAKEGELQRAVASVPRASGLTPQDAARIEQMRVMRERATRNVRAPAHHDRAIPPVRLEAHAARDSAVPPAVPWADPDRPQGSQFSAEQWAAARASFPDCCVFELDRRACSPGGRAHSDGGTPRQARCAGDPRAELLEGSLVSPQLTTTATAAQTAPAAPVRTCELVFCHVQPDGKIEQEAMNLVMPASNP